VSPLQLLVAGTTVAIGSCVQGALGFGFALIGAPVLVLIDPHLVPVPLSLASLLLSGGTSYRERGSIDTTVGWAMLGRVPGALVGAFAIAALPERPLAVTFGVLVLAAVAVSLSGWSVAPSARSLLAAGAISGFTGTTVAIDGPPMALVYQRARGATLRGTMSLYFLVGSVLSLAALAVFGKLGERELRAAIELVPFVAVGFALSGAVARALDRGYTRTAVLVLAAVSSLVLIAHQLGG
jgi:uncharacterized membrane protein YfcA